MKLRPLLKLPGHVRSRRIMHTGMALAMLLVIICRTTLADDSNDKFVIRRHAHMLMDTGVDAVFLDATNAVVYTKEYMTLLRVFQKIREEGGSGNLTAFVRARPGEIDAPVVIHLVEWGGSPHTAKLLLRNELFFGERGLKVSLVEPVPYDTTLHGEAAARALEMLGSEERLSTRQAPAYARLARETQAKVVPRGLLTEVKIPPLSPWALLVVSPGEP